MCFPCMHAHHQGCTASNCRHVMTQYACLARRDGYDSVQYCEQVVAKYKAAQIPLETFVSDIQYANASQAFTLSSNYDLSGMQAFVAQLHAAGQRWVGCSAASCTHHIKPEALVSTDLCMACKRQ